MKHCENLMWHGGIRGCKPKGIYIYIYIYIEREREREREIQVISGVTLQKLHIF